jgi:hypothetical protein
MIKPIVLIVFLNKDWGATCCSAGESGLFLAMGLVPYRIKK